MSLTNVTSFVILAFDYEYRALDYYHKQVHLTNDPLVEYELERTSFIGRDVTHCSGVQLFNLQLL